MTKLKKLQDRFKKGEITLEQYKAELQKLLEGEYIDQEQHDEALDFDPEDDKPIYTQADVDGFIVKKAVAMVRKALKDAGMEVEAGNKELLGKVVELAKAGQAGDAKATDKDLERLKVLEAKLPGLETKLKDMALTNAVFATVSKYNPHNPVQVVRALKLDYMDLIDIDEETGEVDSKTIEKAIKRIAYAEPNLFKAADGGDDLGDEGDEGTLGFKGKGPGGATAGGDALAAKKAQGLAMLNITKK